jgi:hypothetical protein
VEIFIKGYRRDSGNVYLTSLMANACLTSGKDKEALKYYKKIENNLESLYFSFMKWIGYVYWQNGHKKEAEEWFHKQKKRCEESLKIERFYNIDANLDLAGVYAFTGEREKAYENLKVIDKIRVCPLWQLNYIKYDPLFKSIRNEPEFQKITSQFESKYQAEHERVRKWLEEQEKRD